MQKILSNIQYEIGSQQIADRIDSQPVMEPFADAVIDFLSAVSKAILNSKPNSHYSDVITFAFWCRKSSMETLKRNYNNGNLLRCGRGCVFHIAPSNVAVNYAYSLVIGLLSGNANLVRLPSKDFPQVSLINAGFKEALEQYPQMAPYVCLVKYGHDKKINDYFSLKCDSRIVWGGDATIAEIRDSPLKPRANEITFADRYSLAVIDSEKYLEAIDKKKIAQDFYDDTYLMDQNACTSPRIVVWLGNKGRSEQAQGIFWSELMRIVNEKYSMQPVQSVDKLVALYRLGADFETARLNEKSDNKLIRIQISELTNLSDYRCNSGFFMEYYARDLDEIESLCENRCQTLAYYGVSIDSIRRFLVKYKPRGIDRVVPIGRTMDFRLVWDGYDLLGQLTRIIDII